MVSVSVLSGTPLVFEAVEDDWSTQDLDAWLAESRFDASAQSRRLERSLAAQASEEASIGGVLRDLGERGASVVMTTVAGRQHRARIKAVGRDFVVVVGLDGPRSEVVVAMHAIDVVRVPIEAEVVGDRADQLDVSLAEVLPTMAVDRPEVLVITFGGQAVRGELRSTGLDVARIRTDGEDRATAYVPVSSIAELVLR